MGTILTKVEVGMAPDTWGGLIPLLVIYAVI